MSEISEVPSGCLLVLCRKGKLKSPSACGEGFCVKFEIKPTSAVKIIIFINDDALSLKKKICTMFKWFHL